ncbi:MAG: galactitol-1-phosphate 5-dehydrogenase [Spirochaetia bacterium]
MNALVLIDDGKLEYRDIPFPEKPDEEASPERKWTLVRVLTAGICGSDLDRAFNGKAYHYPLVMGHEFTAEIAEPARGGVLKEGTRAAVFPLIPCKVCTPCRTGNYAQCENYDYLGSRTDGAFAEYVWVPEENLFPIPEGLDPVAAAMTEPAAVALHGIRKLEIEPGMTGAVIGGGPIGNLAAQWLRAAGCMKVFLADIDPAKLKIARDMGFIAVDSGSGDPVQSIIDQTDGRGADCAVEACGLPVTFLQTIQSASRYGTVLFMGNIRGEFKIPEKDFSGILRRELRIYGTWNSSVLPAPSDDWSTAIRAMDRSLDCAPLISHTPDLSDGVSVFNDIHGGNGFFNKVIFRVSGERK